jgi:hypothetical protein
MRATHLVLFALALAACGGAPRGDATIVIPPSAAERDAGAPIAREDAGPALPKGANGPRDPVGLIGEAGKIVPANRETVLLVNSAEIRAHPWGNDLRAVITTVLAGWSQFMPYDLVHPTDDVDYVVLSGSLWLRMTRDNVLLARHRVPEPRADAVFATLAQRLGGQATDVGVPGTKAITGEVDGADRTFVRPRPGVLAVTPPADAARTAEFLRRTPLPDAVRRGELVRITYEGRRGMLTGWLPDTIGSLRFWVTADGGKTTANLEGDCASAADAEGAVKVIQEKLAREQRSLPVRMLSNGILERIVVWQDGAIVRLLLDLQAEDVRLATVMACLARGAPCATE